MAGLHQVKNAIIQYDIHDIDYSFEKIISYSQFSQWKQCPLKWALSYKDKLGHTTPNINMTFGTAIHETIQKYLDILYNRPPSELSDFEIEKYFKEKYIQAYQKDYKKNKNTHFSSPDEMSEFFEDGKEIISFLIKNKNKYFPKIKNHLLGCEIPLVFEVRPNVFFKGMIDIVLFDEKTGRVRIIDLKTSTRGWKDKEKKDNSKLNQILLYKEFFSSELNIDIDSIDVEFIILKRKIWDKCEYPQPRFQSFIPSSGKNKRKIAITDFNDFVIGCFTNEGKIIEKEYEAKVSGLCKFCQFYKTKHCPKT